MRPLRTVFVAFAAALACAPAAAAAPPWSAPVTLSQPDQSVDDSHVAVSGNGTAIAVWARSNGAHDVVQASLRSPGGDFGAPIDLSTGGASATSPSVAVDDAGNAIVAWRRLDGNPIIRVARRAAGGSFGAPVDVSLADRSSSSPEVALAPSGEAIVVWRSTDGPETLAMASIAPPGGDFGAPIELSARGTRSARAGVAMDAAGNAIAVWERDGVIRARIRPAGGSFGSTIDLTAPGMASGPTVAMNAGGDAIVAWSRSDGANRIVQARMRPAGGAFGPTDDAISSPGEDADGATAALDAAGGAIVAWSRSDGANERVQAASAPAGGSFGAPVDLSPSGGDAFSPALAIDPAGDAVVAWSTETGPDQIVQAARRPSGGGFALPVDVSAPTGRSTDVVIGIDDEGSPLVVWQRFETKWFTQASFLDAAAPRFTSVSIPATGTVGVPVAFSASALDIWSPFSLGWTFGDGAAASGAATSHAYATPGTYEVRVTATDATGAAATTSGAIAISADVPAPPVISALRVRPRAFRAARRGGSVAKGSARARGKARGRARVRTGGRVAFRLDRAARVRFTVERMAPGRRAGRRCVRPARRNLGGRRCVRRVRVPGAFASDAKAGRNVLVFTGRIKRRTLRPGAYRLVAIPTADGLRGNTARTKFKIRKPARTRPRR